MNPTLPSRAGQLDLTIDQGADFDETFTLGVRSEADPTQVLPYDLTGCSAELKAGAGPLVLHLTDGAGLTLGGIAGTVQIRIDDSETAGLSADAPIPYWCNVIYANGNVRRFLEGYLIVRRNHVNG